MFRLILHCLVIWDWNNYTCTESCAAKEDAMHGCESLGTGIQSIREIDDSGCTLLSNNSNMLTNMIGSSSLKSTDHTNQVKPGHLSDRFILKRELHMDDNSESESEFESDFEGRLGIMCEFSRRG